MLALWLTLLPGCAWVSDKTAQARLDPDGDGVLLDADCDDADPDVSAPATYFADMDADGYGDPASGTEQCGGGEGWVLDSSDCDDTRGDVFPGATDPCDGVDQDCAGDDDVLTTYFRDGDGDGFGGAITAAACEAPSGYTDNDLDCDDGDGAVNPDAEESCATEGDDDCDGDTQTAADAPTWFADADGDGFGDAAVTTAQCDAPVGAVADASDCDDTDSSVGGPTLWHADADGDGFGAGEGTLACALEGAVGDASDCDDARADVSPAAVEQCATGDEDCDTLEDDADPDVADTTGWYADGDGDGFGAGPVVASACVQPANSSGTDDDCDDRSPRFNPGATETCTTTDDDDCDGDRNDLDALGCNVRYSDVDADGYGSVSSECRCVALGVYDSLVNTDCDDSSAAANPGAAEVWYSGADERCDGGSDYDQDADGYDLDTYAGTDCDDTDAAVSPAATEVCEDGLDNNCDGGASECLSFGATDAAVAAGTVIYADEGDATFFGGAVAVGPMNSDGADDLVVGAVGWSGSGGAAYQYTSVSSGTSSSSGYAGRLYAYSGEFGTSVALNPDNSDPRLAVGHPGYDGLGAVWQFAVPNNGYMASNACAEWVDGQASYAGSSVAWAPDLDGDGEPEVVIGAPYADSYGGSDGEIVVVSNARCTTGGVSLADGWGGGNSDARLGSALAVGDVTGDGIEDIIGGADGALSESGAVFVLEHDTRGYADAPGFATATWTGVTAGDRAGRVLCFADDVTGDGLGDVVVGAPDADDGGTDGGVVYVVPGGVVGTYALSAAWGVVTGDTAYGRVGSACAVADLDDDGGMALIVGAEGDVLGAADGTDHGRVWVWHSITAGSVLSSTADWEIVGASEDHFGASLAVGDVDADGFTDIFVGAPDDSTWAYAKGGAVYGFYGSGR